MVIISPCQQQKNALLSMTKDNKDLLFGSFSTTVTKTKKEENKTEKRLCLPSGILGGIYYYLSCISPTAIPAYRPPYPAVVQPGPPPASPPAPTYPMRVLTFMLNKCPNDTLRL
uniref:Uncharacterized protein n=1 Tax=Romanomermis culicivorax TaxID=13658 RepID=A0A915KBP2_ROMCU